MELIITAGECLKELLGLEKAVPFNEAMIQGNCHKELFSDSFIEIRSQSLGVDSNLYRKKLGLFLDAMTHLEDYSRILLCFGNEPFCIMNILTLLAYLEVKQYTSPITLQYYNEYTGEVLETKEIILGDYNQIYRSVLVEHQQVHTNIKEIDEAIQIYLKERK